MSGPCRGSSRGRRAAGGSRVPPGQATRPTSDRAREALFSTLESLSSAWPAAGCSTCTPARAPSGSRRSAAAPPTRCSSSPTPGRPAPSADERGDPRAGRGRGAPRPGRAAGRRPGCPAPAYDVVFADPPYDLDDDVAGDGARPTCARRLAGRRRRGGRRARHPRRRAGPGRPGSRRCGPGATARPRFGTVAPLRAYRPPPPASRRAQRDRAPLRVPRLLRPGDQRPPRHHRARQPAVRRGDRGGARQPAKTGLFEVDERIEMLAGGHGRAWATCRVDSFQGLLVDYCRDQRHPGGREGPARGQRLRLRAADGADEPPAGRRRDAVRRHQPGVLVPLV